MIRLIENFYLDADDRQYILLEWDGSYDKKTGKNKQNVSYWYCSKLASALDVLLSVLVRRGIAASEESGIPAVKKIIRDETDRIRKMLENVEPTLDSIAPMVKNVGE